MDFNEYQASALRTAPEGESQTVRLIHAALGLSTESGEYISEVKRIVFYKKELTPDLHTHMCKELGDVLWYVALGCDALGVSMHSIARGNIAKLQIRFPDKFSPEAAEARADMGGVGHRES